MNINAINQLSIKKNDLKLKESIQKQAFAEQSSAKADNVMNALHIQGMNNIAFQANPAKLTNVVKEFGKKAAIVLPLLIGAGAVTSCDPDYWYPDPIVYPIENPNKKDSVVINVDVNNEVNINIDMDQSLIAEWLEKLYEQNQISQEENAEWRAMMLDLIKKYGDNAEAYQSAMLDFAAKIALSTATSAENAVQINTKIDKIIKMYENGEITWEEALKLLSQINGKLDDILARLDDIAYENKVMREELAKEQNKANELLDKLVNNQLTVKEFNELKKIIEGISDNVSIIRFNTLDLIALVKDPTRHEELIETIKNSANDPIEYEKFEELFKFYGLTIADAIEMSGEELAAKLDLFMEKYAANEALNQLKLDEISKKIGDISNDIAAIKAWLKEIKPANGQDYSGAIEKIIVKLDNLNLLSQENSKILKEILEAIKNHKCDCNCADSGNHEGILGDVEDALNGLV